MPGFKRGMQVPSLMPFISASACAKTWHIVTAGDLSRRLVGRSPVELAKQDITEALRLHRTSLEHF